jgi:hypothetical protein
LSDAVSQRPMRRRPLPDRCAAYAQKCAQKLQTTPSEATYRVQSKTRAATHTTRKGAGSVPGGERPGGSCGAGRRYDGGARRFDTALIRIE